MAKKDQAELKVNVSGDLTQLETKLRELESKGVKVSLVPIDSLIKQVKAVKASLFSLNRAIGSKTTGGLVSRLRSLNDQAKKAGTGLGEVSTASSNAVRSINAFTTALSAAASTVVTKAQSIGGSSGGSSAFSQTATLAGNRRTATVVRESMEKLVRAVKTLPTLNSRLTSTSPTDSGRVLRTSPQLISAARNSATRLSRVFSGLGRTVVSTSKKFEELIAVMNFGKAGSLRQLPAPPQRKLLTAPTVPREQLNIFNTQSVAVSRYSKLLTKLQRSLRAASKSTTALRKHVDRSTKSFKEGDRALSDYIRFIGKFAVASAIVFAFPAAIRAMVTGFVDLVKVGLEFNEILETAQVGISSIVVAQASVFKNGEKGNRKEISGLQAVIETRKIAIGQLEKLRIAGLKTAATTNQLAFAFQQAIGPGLAAGISNFDTLRKITVEIVQGAFAIGVPMRQLNEEVRSLLTGAINPINSRLAAVLNITGAMVKDWRESGHLADELLKRMAPFEKAGELVFNTFAGIKSNIVESLGALSGNAFGGFFSELKLQLQGIVENIVPDASAGIISPELLASGHKLDVLLVKLTKHLDPLVKRFIKLSNVVLDNTDVISNFFHLVGNFIKGSLLLKFLFKWHRSNLLLTKGTGTLAKVMRKVVGGSEIFIRKFTGSARAATLFGFALKRILGFFTLILSNPLIRLFMIAGGILLWTLHIKFGKGVDKETVRITKELKQAKEDLDNIQAKINQVNKKGGLVNAPDTANNLLNQANQSLAGPQLSLSKIADKIETAQSALNHENSKLKDLISKNVNGKNNRAISGEEIKVRDLTSRLDALRSKYIELTAVINPLIETQKTLKGTLQGNIDIIKVNADIKSTVDTLTQISNKTETRGEKFTRFVDGAKTRLEELKAQIKSLGVQSGPTFDSLTASALQLQNAINLKGPIADAVVAFEDAQGAAKGFRQELHEISSNKQIAPIDQIAQIEYLSNTIKILQENLRGQGFTDAADALQNVLIATGAAAESSGAQVDEFINSVTNSFNKAADPLAAFIQKTELQLARLKKILNTATDPKRLKAAKAAIDAIYSGLPAKLEKFKKSSKSLFAELTKGTLTWGDTFLGVFKNIQTGFREIVYNSIIGDTKGIHSAFKNLAKNIVHTLTNKVADNLFKSFLTKIGVPGASDMKTASDKVLEGGRLQIQAAQLMLDVANEKNPNFVGPPRTTFDLNRLSESNGKFLGLKKDKYFSKFSETFKDALNKWSNKLGNSKIGSFFAKLGVSNKKLKKAFDSVGSIIAGYNLGQAIGGNTASKAIFSAIGSGSATFAATENPYAAAGAAAAGGALSFYGSYNERIAKRDKADEDRNIFEKYASSSRVPGFSSFKGLLPYNTSKLTQQQQEFFGNKSFIGDLNRFDPFTDETTQSSNLFGFGKHTRYHPQGGVGSPENIFKVVIEDILGSPNINTNGPVSNFGPTAGVGTKAFTDFISTTLKDSKLPVITTKQLLDFSGISTQYTVLFNDLQEKLTEFGDALTTADVAKMDDGINNFVQSALQSAQDFVSKLNSTLDNIKTLTVAQSNFALSIGNDINTAIGIIPGNEKDIFARLLGNEQATKKTLTDLNANPNATGDQLVGASQGLQGAANTLLSYVQSHPDVFFGKELLSIRDTVIGDLTLAGKSGVSGFDALLENAKDQLVSLTNIDTATSLIASALSGITSVTDLPAFSRDPQTEATVTNGGNTVAFQPHITINADLNNLTDEDITELLVRSLREGTPELIGELRHLVVTT